MTEVAHAKLTSEACKVITRQQLSRLAVILGGEEVSNVHVTKAGIFDLPDGYVYVRIDYKDGHSPMYGGISPEGEMST